MKRSKIGIKIIEQFLKIKKKTFEFLVFYEPVDEIRVVVMCSQRWRCLLLSAALCCNCHCCMLLCVVTVTAVCCFVL